MVRPFHFFGCSGTLPTGMPTGPQYRFTLVAVLVLASCTRGGAEDPTVVLERAAGAAQQLQSASFRAAVSYETQNPPSSMRGELQGVLADAGRQLSFTADGTLSMKTDGLDQIVTVAGDVVVAGENEAYVRLRRADGGVLLLPGIGLVPEELLGRWYRTADTPSPTAAITSDPAFIAMQTRVLDVLEDRSYEEIDGERCYVYDVTIDREKMMAFLEQVALQRKEPFDRDAAVRMLDSYEATGTIWIDTSTAVVRRVRWLFKPIDEQEHGHMSLDIHISKHNEPVKIVPPTGASLLSTAFPQPSLPSF